MRQQMTVVSPRHGVLAVRAGRIDLNIGCVNAEATIWYWINALRDEIEAFCCSFSPRRPAN